LDLKEIKKEETGKKSILYFVLLTKYYKGDQSKENKIDGVCCGQGIDEN
jgi:hypothetical protein